eukprot:CAMPEP_0169403674 /NCGR_PEP_ID=MMETSP1017-20121227/55903_1 /TAXON_ID=342587 /ORGANISM="Karlodinium micrum, Strain CCMP2283" /LENGTH=207 /DNA_ID=CAMNT_0009509947 /DNA_START=932 /DNA_END=1556 /DNA_ORIENTATION=+
MGMKFSLLRKGLTKFSSKFSNVRTEFTSGDRISPKAVRARVTCLETGVRKTGVGVALDVVQGDGGSVMGCLEEMMEVPSACNAGAVSDRRHRAKSEEPMCLIGVACGVLFGVGFGVGRGVWTTGCGVCAMLSFNTCAARGAAVAPKGSEPGKAGYEQLARSYRARASQASEHMEELAPLVLVCLRPTQKRQEPRHSLKLLQPEASSV